MNEKIWNFFISKILEYSWNLYCEHCIYCNFIAAHSYVLGVDQNIVKSETKLLFFK